MQLDGRGRRADTAEGVISEASDWLTPEEYSALEAMPLDDSDLPKLEQQQRAQKERQLKKKQARRTMLQDIKRTVGKHVARQSAIVKSPVNCTGADTWSPLILACLIATGQD